MLLGGGGVLVRPVASKIATKWATRKAVSTVTPRLLSPSSLAHELASRTGGVVTTNKGGYTVNIPHGKRGITVRVMDKGGSRTNYYRISVPGKESYTAAGKVSTDARAIHVDITENSLLEI